MFLGHWAGRKCHSLMSSFAPEQTYNAFAHQLTRRFHVSQLQNHLDEQFSFVAVKATICTAGFYGFFFFFSPPPLKICYYFSAALAVPCDGFFAFFHLIRLVWNVFVCLFLICSCFPREQLSFSKGLFTDQLKFVIFMMSQRRMMLRRCQNFRCLGKSEQRSRGN